MQWLTILSFIGFLQFSFASQGCITQTCSARNAQADIVFVIDTSASMGDMNFAQIKNFLYNLVGDFTIGSGTDQTQFAFITYSQSASTYGNLKQGNTASDVNATIASLQFAGYATREINKALVSEEVIITAAGGLRDNAKKLLIAIIADAFTGDKPDQNGILSKVRGKYDALLSIAVGPNAIQYAYTDVTTFSGSPGDTFFITGPDQLDFAQLWIERNACPAYNAPTTYVPSTLAPTQDPSVTCTLTTLKYDIYLMLDMSNVMSSTDFSDLKTVVTSFVNQYSIDDGSTQFALIAVSVDAQRYYTGFHAGQKKSNVLTAINMLVQEPSNGQALDLAFRVADNAFFQTYANDSNVQLVVYFSANTNFDKDPTPTVSSLKTKYGLNIVSVQLTIGADKTKLTSLSGGASCVLDATTVASRKSLSAILEQLTCSKAFC